MMDRGSVFNNILGEVRRHAPGGVSFDIVNAGLVVPPEEQPRKHFDSEALQSLADSIREHGVLQPLVVRPMGDGIYEVVAGERRLRASQIAGLEKLPVMIWDADPEESMYLLSLAENLQRENLNAIEETEGILAALQLALRLGREEVISLLYRMERERKGEAEESHIPGHTAAQGAENESSEPHNGPHDGSDEDFGEDSGEDVGEAHNNVIVTGSDVSEGVSGKQAETVRALFGELGTMGVGSFLNNRLPLLSMPDDVLSACRDEGLAYTKARAMSGVEDDTRRRALIRETLEAGLSVSEVRQRVAEESGGAAGSGRVGEPESPALRLRSRASGIARAMKKSRDLDEDKARRANELLDELEALISG